MGFQWLDTTVKVMETVAGGLFLLNIVVRGEGDSEGMAPISGCDCGGPRRPS